MITNLELEDKPELSTLDGLLEALIHLKKQLPAGCNPRVQNKDYLVSGVWLKVSARPAEQVVLIT